jgi:deoxyribonucleoside regulator
MLLTEAKNVGIVNVQIKDPYANNEELAHALEERFGLKECIVAPTNIGNEGLLLKIVASQAARFAAELMTSHSSIAMSWGSACYQFMQEFTEDTELCDINVVPLIGGSPLLVQEFQINESIRNFAEKLRGTPVFIYSPGIVDSLDDKKHIMETMYMQTITERWKSLDFAVLGIGRPPESYKYEQAPFDIRSTIDQLKRNPDLAVGDLCARWFNIRGEIMDCEHNNKLIGIDETGLKNTKKVMAIACGVSKALSIIGALRTKLIHHLITDEHTAKQVLIMSNSEI